MGCGGDRGEGDLLYDLTSILFYCRPPIFVSIDAYVTNPANQPCQPTMPQLCSKDGGLQPLVFNLSLRRAPASVTTVALTLSDDEQGTLQPRQVVFDRW